MSPRETPDADVPPGLLLVDKPGGMTSHDVVARARRVLSVRKVGHAGTLDPMATGLLVLGVGAATRLLGYVGGHDKTYEATIRLGQSTVTDDREGEVLDDASTAALDDDAIRTALAAQTGPLQQVPSSVSAVKVDGRRSYDRVRAGEDGRARAARRSPSTGSTCTASRGRRPTWSTSTSPSTCTAGTYIRAIARDAGAALGVGGHLTALRRTAVGAVRGRAGRAGRGRRGGAGRRRGAGVLGLTDAARRCSPSARSPRRRPPPSATASASRRPAHPACTPPSTPTAGWSRWSRTPGATARVAVGFPPR